jgi:peptidoglycan-N-acetylglucosamine deacetylase
MGLAPGLRWHMPRKDKVLYLTFDDGPHPEITLEVMETLAAYQAKASFFCVGENVARFPDVVRLANAAGHRIGNHTQHHLNGWKTERQDYLADIAACDSALETALGMPVHHFRPPYGKIKLSTIWPLKRRYEVVMWDVVGGDFVQDWDAGRVTDNVLRHAQAGSIVVLHDSEKCYAKLMPALNATLRHFSELGFEFRALPG